MENNEKELLTEEELEKVTGGEQLSQISQAPNTFVPGHPGPGPRLPGPGHPGPMPPGPRPKPPLPPKLVPPVMVPPSNQHHILKPKGYPR